MLLSHEPPTDPPLAAQPEGGPWVQPWRMGPLMALCSRQLQRGWGIRLVWVVAVLVVAINGGGVFLQWVAAALGPAHAANELQDAGVRALAGALPWLFWLSGGLAAWGCACRLDLARSAAAILELAQCRGYSRQQVVWARSLATLRTLVWTMALPAVVLALPLLVLAPDAAGFCLGLKGLGFAVGFGTITGTALAAVVLAAQAMSPNWPRQAVLGLFVIPELSRWVFPDLVGFSALIDLSVAGLFHIANGGCG